MEGHRMVRDVPRRLSRNSNTVTLSQCMALDLRFHRAVEWAIVSEPIGICQKSPKKLLPQNTVRF